MFFPVSGWFAAFVLTLTVEVPIVVRLLRSAEPSLPRRLGLAVLANLATHPAVWYVISQLLLVGTLEYTALAESWAIVVETAFYIVAIRGLDPRRAVVVAVVANGASFAIGRIVGAIRPDLF